MAGRGPQTFQKRQKEQQRKEKQQEKLAKRLQRKQESRTSGDAPSKEDGTDAAE
jgi:hypothetical protein